MARPPAGPATVDDVDLVPGDRIRFYDEDIGWYEACFLGVMPAESDCERDLLWATHWTVLSDDGNWHDGPLPHQDGAWFADDLRHVEIKRTTMERPFG